MCNSLGDWESGIQWGTPGQEKKNVTGMCGCIDLPFQTSSHQNDILSLDIFSYVKFDKLSGREFYSGALRSIILTYDSYDTA